jgi:hypothetical protein
LYLFRGRLVRSASRWLSAYEHWLDHEDASLQDLLDEAMSELRNQLSGHTGT